MYNYGYDNDLLGLGSSAVGSSVGSLVWVIIAFLVSLVGCFLIYFLFVKKDNKLENKKLAWLRSFLRFDKMLIETILKIVYIFAALLVTLLPFAGITSFGSFIGVLLFIIFGNILLRITYELIMINIMVWKNTTEIKNKVK